MMDPIYIYVCIKQVPDTGSTLALASGVASESDVSFGEVIKTDNLKWITNPYDEYALEQAIRIKEELTRKVENLSAVAVQIIAIRLGETVPGIEVLRSALALGADEAILVETPKHLLLDPLLTARGLMLAMKKHGKQPDLVLTGKESSDGNYSQVPQLLAQMLGFPAITSISGYCNTDTSGILSGIEVCREVEGGDTEVFTARLPLVLSCSRGLNTIRYPSVPGIMRAKKKPITCFTLEELGVDFRSGKYLIENISLPPERTVGKMFLTSTDTADTTNETVKEVVQEIMPQLVALGDVVRSQ
ncbi:MAG: electron transfer flavoprotein subunit beta/FixA family protein [Oligoflexia bacterium]|nr:electron transfer flavoprotein subunit beta/FixA family protein [Oligoflexia bacterium]